MASCQSQGYLEPVNGNIKKQEPLTQRKRKRHLEVLSITCSTVGINIVIACFCGIPSSFGIKSPDTIFKCAFTFLVASVLLGILAMISSIRGYEFLQDFFITILRHSLHRFLNLLRRLRNKTFQPRDNTVVETENSQVTSRSIDDPRNAYNQECGYHLESLGQSSLPPQKISIPSSIAEQKNASNMCETAANVDSAAPTVLSNQHCGIATVGASGKSQQTQPCSGNFSLFGERGPLVQRPASYNQLVPRNLLQLKKKRSCMLFGQFYATDSSGFTTGPVTFSCEVRRNNQAASLSQFQLENLAYKAVTTGDQQFCVQQQSSETPDRWLHTKTDHVVIGNSHFETGINNNSHDSLPLSRTFQVHSTDHVSNVIQKLNEMNFVS